jgi:ubiquitin carboxyl-terminal hydrolase L3
MRAVIPGISDTKALIFLYRLSDFPDQPTPPISSGSDVFFMKQTVENACGTIALIHVLANSPVTYECDCDAQSYIHDYVSSECDCNLQSFIYKFVTSNEGLSPEERGKRVELDDEIRSLHASFSAKGQTAAPDALDDIDLHFVAFVKGKNGGLYELDGRQADPIRHGTVGEGPGAFFSACSHAIQRKYLSVVPNSPFVALALVPAHFK